MIWLLAKLIPMKLIGLVVLAVVVFAATGGDPIGMVQAQVVDPIITAVENWLQSQFSLTLW